MEFTETYIGALVKGDKNVFHLLYENFFIALCIFARGFGLDREEAEDIVQEIFCKLYDERKNLSDIRTLKSYLYTSVRNRCLNYLRDEKRRRSNEIVFSDSLDRQSYFFDQIVENEVYRELKFLMNELPPQCRNIFERTLNGVTSEQIAVEMGLSVETVKTQRKKAKKILRERYALLYKTFNILF